MNTQPSLFHDRAPRTKLQIVLTLFIAFVFIQSLFFKFTNSPETQHIFGTLDAWAGVLGFPGLFAPGGIFSATVIGSAELIASSLLILGIVTQKRWMQIIGAAMALGTISGAILFHLFTPLGVSVRNTDGSYDGGLLFGMACGVWISAAVLLFQHRAWIFALLGRRA
jgi:uncharacterized membrane protein YphA (DoxX/SURF4 family)